MFAEETFSIQIALYKCQHGGSKPDVHQETEDLVPTAIFDLVPASLKVETMMVEMVMLPLHPVDLYALRECNIRLEVKIGISSPWFI